MAITKLMHMKESPGCPHDHLRNAINYILDVKNGCEKTKGGLLVGGNSGLDHNEILENFLETKRSFGKMDGRQGYHFVISFAKGEVDEATAYEIVREFCEQYLEDYYDYVFAIHNDKEHLHGHIVFNSVSRTDGYKFHYKKGDWEKIIQPITDRLCVEHGLAPLTFGDERVGVSYASWATEHGGKFDWKSIIRADVDFAIQQANTFEEFQTIMRRMGYHLRFGYSTKHNTNYITYTFIEPSGKKHRSRSYNLAAGYSPEEIMQRIQTKEGSRSYEEIVERLSKMASDYLKPAVLKSTQTYKRLYQAVSYYKLPNPYAVPSYRVRKDMIRIDKLLEECRYLKENNITNKSELERRGADLNERLYRLNVNRKTLYGIKDQMVEEQLAMMERYRQLQEKRNQIGRGDAFEEVEDEMTELEQMFPPKMLETKSRIEEYSKEISVIRKELRLIERILKTETEKEAPVPVQPIKK